jgi:peptidase A4-like protein
MKPQRKFGKLAVFAVMGSLLLSLSALAMAESDAAGAIRASAATIATNIPGIRSYAEPPKGFNPVTATDEELATYGFPPRPDKLAHANEYAQWERAMKLAKIHWHGELKALPGGGLKIPSGSSPLPEAVQPETSGPKDIQTNNASGVIVASGQKSFNKNSIGNVFAFITVPTVEAPLDNSIPCSGQGYIAIATVGIDGFVFDTGNGHGYDPQLEAGLFEQLACSGDIYYFAVFGYQGSYTIPFFVNPGDVLYAFVDTSGGSNSFAYLQDNTTGTYGSYSVTTSGIAGKTANWMVERFCCSGNEPITLANTTNIAFGGAFAGNEIDEKFFYPGSQATTTEILAMTDDAGDQTIEQVTQGSTGYEGRSGLWFETNNCGAFYGCTP